MTLERGAGAGITLGLWAGVALALAGCTSLTPQARTAALIQRAQAALGSAELKTLTVTGHGSAASVGQAYAPGTAWPGLTMQALSRSMNFETASFREEYIRSRSEALGGGAVPLLGAGESRGLVLAREDRAWDVAGTGTVPAPAALAARVHDLWTGTPQGAIKAAERMGARAGTRRAFLRQWDTLSFEMPGQFSATVVLEDSGVVSRVESTLTNAVLGEIPVVTEFSDYRPHAGLNFPDRILQRQGGFAALDLQVTAVTANEAVEITIPENVRAAVETVSVEKVADGVWFLAGGTHNSVAIEHAEQIVLVEAPLSAARASAVFDAANQLVPGKAVRTVVSSHHHFDHAGGLRTAAGAGATIIASMAAQPYFERVLAPPGGRPTVVGVDRKTVLRDDKRPIEIFSLEGSVHAEGLLIVWLPRERLLVEADAYTPAAPGTPPPAVPNGNHLNLVENLDRLGLAPLRILPLHGRVVAAAELYAQVGRKPPP